MSAEVSHAEDDLPTKKGRSNAILTYEKLSEFDNKLTFVATGVERLSILFKGLAQNKDDHEARLRVLESDVKRLLVTSETTKSTAQLNWQGWTTLANLALSAASVIVMLLILLKK